MKNKIMFVLAFLLAVNVSAFAQQGGGRQQMSVEERVKVTLERLTTELKLEKDQVTKLDTIFTRSFKEQKKLRDDAQASGNRPDREVFQKLNTERDEKVKGVLTEDQYKKYKEQQEAMRQRGGGGGGNRPGGSN